MSDKQIYHAPDGIQTLEVPYIEGMDGESNSPRWFLDRIEVPGFELHEIQGSRMINVDGEWCEVGYKAIYTRVK